LAAVPRLARAARAARARPPRARRHGAARGRARPHAGVVPVPLLGLREPPAPRVGRAPPRRRAPRAARRACAARPPARRSCVMARTPPAQAIEDGVARIADGELRTTRRGLLAGAAAALAFPPPGPRPARASQRRR